MNTFNTISIFLIALGTTIGLVYLTILVTKAKGWVYQPQQDRWNTNVVSLHGGVALFVAYTIIVVLFTNTLSSTIFPLLILPAIMAVTGLLDDRFLLNPLTKLGVELVVALVAISQGIMFTISGNFYFDSFVTIFWIIGIINAINLMDNMDGAAAGVCLIIAIYLGFIAPQMAIEVKTIAVILTGLLLAFMIFNFNPAKIFMGDSGSLFLGALIALLVLKIDKIPIENAISNYPTGFLMAIMILIIPIADTILVTFNRAKRGLPVYQGDKGHITHRISYLTKNDKLSVLLIFCYQSLILVFVYFEMYTACIALIFLTIVLLILLTVKTNQFVWPNRSA